MAVNCNITATLSIWYCYKEKQNTVSPLKYCSCSMHVWGCFMSLQFTSILNILFLFKINCQRITVSLEHLYFFLQQPPQWIPCHFTLALSWACAHVLYLSVSLVCVYPHVLYHPRSHQFQKLVFKGMIDALGFASVWAGSGTPLMWGWGDTALPRIPSCASKACLYLEEYSFPSQAPTGWEFQGQQLAENSMKLQWLIYCIGGRKQNYLSKLVWLIGKLASR